MGRNTESCYKGCCGTVSLVATFNTGTGVLVPILATSLLTRFTVSMPGKAVGDDPSTWVSASHVWNLDGAPGSWLTQTCLL